MDTFLVVLALTAQLSDTALTCHVLRDGRMREGNPLFGGRAVCGRVLAYKAGALLTIPLLRGKWRTAAIGMNIASGSVGVTITLYNRRRLTGGR